MFVSLIELFFSALVVALPVWWWAGLTEAVLAALMVVLVCAVRVIWKTYRIERWLSESDLHTPVPWKGVWSEIAHRIQRLLRQRENQVIAAEQRLQYFLQAIQASPNGVTLLDAQGRIEWCNQMAASQFGFDAQRDVMQSIGNLVRDPEFTAYYAAQDFSHDVVLEGRFSTPSRPVRISVHLHPYGDGRTLLLSRDVTALEQAEAMRRDFVANVSHEIRTPLTVLTGFVETLQTLPLDETEQGKYLGLMSQQATRMQSLVDDLLTLSRLEGSPAPSGADLLHCGWRHGPVAPRSCLTTDHRLPVHECPQALAGTAYPRSEGVTGRTCHSGDQHANPSKVVSGINGRIPWIRL